MRIDAPSPAHVPHLRSLWQDAFGDSNDFLDLFFTFGFSPECCRCVFQEDTPVAAAYWFDCTLEGRKIAYLYAVATLTSHRGRGLCRMLMEDIRRVLAETGYCAAVLVPQSEGLRQMYRRMGYRDAGSHRAFSCTAAADPVPLRSISPEEFARRRRELLPKGGVIQEGRNLAFLSHLAEFYAGEGFLMAACREGDCLIVPEYLGDPSLCPGILRSLGCETGTFRSPRGNAPFAMALPLQENAPEIAYFGFAFD